MSISGYATIEGTANFAKNNPTVNPKNYRVFEGLTLSNVGIGTYLGNADSETDKLVTDAIKESIKSGINVVDTAINYRSQKAERSVGKAISELINHDKDHKIERNNLFICTKNGYVTNDADNEKEDFWQHIKTNYTEKNIIKSGDISSNYHCMTTSYLKDQLDRSLKNLGLECIDLIYLHNPAEGQLQDISKDQLLQRLYDVFSLYEEKRKEGIIRYYGLATWDCFRVEPEHALYMSLDEVLNIAKDISDDPTNHGFRFIQLPFNMYLDQAFMQKNHKIDQNQVSILQSAASKNIGVFSSVPFMQGRLLQDSIIPETFKNMTPATFALQFIRSTPGILAPLAGQKSKSHVTENLEIMKIPPLNEEQFYDLLNKLVNR